MSIFRRVLLPALVAVLAAGACLVPTPAAQAASGGLSLFTPTTNITATVYGTGADASTDVEPALYMAAAATAPFEVLARRTSYDRPVSAIATIGNVTRFVPPSLLAGWDGFAKAFTLTWRSSSGRVVSAKSQAWCPNNGVAGRYSPLGSVSNRYDTFCVSHPFAKSDRWGIERGWATQVFGFGIDAPTLTVGATYTLQAKLSDALGNFLGIPASSRSFTYRVKVVKGDDSRARTARSTTGGKPTGPTNAASRSAASAPKAPAGTTREAPRDTLPDLVALPALGISTHAEGGRDELDFGATIYNAGQAPLVAEGFRRGSSGTMDAFQYFYRGTQVVGSAKVGTMMFDSRPTHLHWHFRDFALYDLVDARGRNVGTSGKEAFCLAPTDAIDMLQLGAAKDPGDSNLSTACGDISSIWVREVLAAGWGDTYTQQRAGQSIDVTNLPNGTYRIRITANPAGHLHELTRANDVALRTIVLGGTKGHRTVKVPPYQLVDSEADINFQALDPDAMPAMS